MVKQRVCAPSWSDLQVLDRDLEHCWLGQKSSMPLGCDLRIFQAKFA